MFVFLMMDVIKGSSHLIFPGLDHLNQQCKKCHNNVPLKVLKKEVIEHIKAILRYSMWVKY